MFQSISPGGAPASAPVQPAPGPSSSAPKANENTVTIDDAIKGGEHAKMTGFSVTDVTNKPGQPGAPGSSVALGGLVQGKVMVELIDALIPAVIVLLFRKMKIDAKKTQMQLTQGEKNTLAPIVEACLNSINLDFSNPWTTLSISMLIIYGGKALEVGGTQWLDKKADEKKEDKKPAPVVPIRNPLTSPGAGKAQAPQPNPPKAATDTGPFTDIKVSQPSGNAIAWTDEDYRKVRRWGRYNHEKAIAWLERNWIKNGCALPAKWDKPVL